MVIEKNRLLKHAFSSLRYLKLFLCLFPIGVSLQAGWYTNWEYRKAITNKCAAGENLTNFPLLLVISNDDKLKRFGSTNGYDIVFTLNDGITKISHEIEYYDSSSAALVAWIRMPVLHGSIPESNIIYMYYKTTNQENQQSTNAVWSADYSLVMHMHNNSGVQKDSSSNAHTGTMMGNAAYTVSGKIGSAVSFDGTDDWIEVPDHASLDGKNKITLSAWIYDTANDSSARGIISKRVSSSSEKAYYLYYSDPGKYTFRPDSDTSGALSSALTASAWHYVTIIFDGSAAAADRIKFYADGSLFDTKTAAITDIPDTAAKLHIGILNASYGYSWQGMIDEVCVSTNIRSDAWIKTCFSNQGSPVNFRTVGSEQQIIYFPELTANSSPAIKQSVVTIRVSAKAVTGILTNIGIYFGDGSAGYSGGGTTDSLTAIFSHAYSASGSYLIQVVGYDDAGNIITNSLHLSVLEYNILNAGNLTLQNLPKGINVTWNMASVANLSSFRIFRNGSLFTEILSNSGTSFSYLDECLWPGRSYNYYIESCYPAGVNYSTTNTSGIITNSGVSGMIGAMGGNLECLDTAISIPADIFSQENVITIKPISVFEFSTGGEISCPYNQVKIDAGDNLAAVKDTMEISVKIQILDNKILLRNEKNEITELNLNDQNKLYLASKNHGGNWRTVSTRRKLAVKTAVYSHLLLCSGINTLGLFGVMYADDNPAERGIDIVNRMFMPGKNNLCGRTIINFPNEDNEAVTIKIYNIKGSAVYQKSFLRMGVFAWDGITARGNYVSTGLYFVNIIVGGDMNRSYNAHVYAVK